MRLLILLCLLALPLRATLNESVLLDAIADVETGYDATKIGAAGERGMWQLTPHVARRVGGYDRAAAARWLTIVIRDMKRAKVDVNPLNGYLVWNAGIGAVRRGQVPVESYRRAVRLTNVYRARLSGNPIK